MRVGAFSGIPANSRASLLWISRLRFIQGTSFQIHNVHTVPVSGGGTHGILTQLLRSPWLKQTAHAAVVGSTPSS